MSKSDNVVSELLGAIDTVVGKRLQQLPYDKTIICTIVDDSNAKNGEYKVTDGSVKFSAKCENANYRVDDQVRVSVPNGDTTQEKFILGKYVKDNSTTPITYMSPLSSVLQMSGNLCTSNNSTFGLQATGTGAREEMMLWSTSIEEKDSAMLGNSIYDILYVQADFKTILSNYHITSGTYGLELRLNTKLWNGEAGPAITCVYDSTQMMGNPYAFGIYTTQAAKFDITNIGNVTGIQLWFYQDGNFKHITYSAEPEPIPTEPFINNILVKNVQIGFGADLTNVADETVKLYTTDDLRFDNDSTTLFIDNTKTLQFAWYNKDENGKYIGFDDAKDPETGIIKFINEDDYLKDAGLNEQLKAQQNYNIPMDEAGLKLASRTAQIKNLMSELSATLSKDFYQLLIKFANRCKIDEYENTFKDLQNFVAEQVVSVTGDAASVTLPAAVSSFYRWYMNALNHAAAIHNIDIIPTTLENEWSFAYEGDLDATEIAPLYLDAFTDYFNALYDKFYPIIDEETQERRFLNDLYLLVTDDFTGYKGIYDDYNSRITKLFNQIWSKWELVGNPTEETEIDDNTGELTVIKPLGLLVNNKEAIENYFKDDYSFTPWIAVDLSQYDNGYCIYWYRYHPDAQGDNFMPRGWQRIADAGNSTVTSIEVTLDATTMTKEEFQVIVFFNHEKYTSNIVTFENQSPVINAATALLSDGISIKHGANSQESYQSYNSTNTLINGAERYKKREIEVQFAHSSGEVDNEALINAQIYWYIPKNATMLTFDTVDLQSLNDTNNFVNDITDTSENKSEYYRDGFTCFYKTIGYGLTEENIADYVNDLKFAYRIKDYYSPASAQNTIICQVVKDNIKYETEILMNFSSYGTSGTDYTLVVAPTESQAAAVAGENWELKIALYNNKNEQITFLNEPSVDFLIKNNAYDIAKEVYQKEDDELSWYVEINTDTSKTLCDILVVTTSVTHGAENGASIALTTYFPIPYSANTNYYIEGATTVIYDSQGNNPSYYKDPYVIYKQAMWNEVEEKWDTSVPEHTWSIHYTPGVSEDAEEKLQKAYDNVKAYLPQLSNGALLPANMWVDGGDITYDGELATSHCAYVQCKSGNNILWSQPILIIQNRYPSPMLNAWDGKFTIDEKNGTIMSTMVSAGRKTQNNTFEGVLMGDIEAGAGFNPDNKSGLGLYGFNDGAQSFGFNIDGTAFLGKSGRGRILFDGNSGAISSASYNDPSVRPQNEDGTGYAPSTAGMMIDLDDGFIEMLGGTKTVNEDGKVSYGTERTEDGAQSKIRISVQSPYFSIDSKAGNRLLNIGDETAFEEVGDELEKGYYFKTDNYVPSTWTSDNTDWTAGSGMLIDLAQGKIDAYDFTLRGEDKDSKSYIKLSSLPNQMVKVFYRDTSIDDDSGLVVFEMGTDNYIMRSFNWWNRIDGGTEPLTGMELNIRDGKFTAYSSNNAQAGKYIVIDASDDSSNYPLMVGTPGSEALKIAWDGALKINNNAFNVDAAGNFWISGEALNSATFSVANDGKVTMKKGSIALGEITKSDGTKVTSFYVDDNGNLSIGGTAFSVNKEGYMTATSGKVGGWLIGETSLKSSNEKMELGSTGTIKIGIYSADSSSGNAFEVTSDGIMKAANYELASGVINTALHMKGKMRIGKDGNPSSIKTQTYQLWIDGSTYCSDNFYMKAGSTLRTLDENGNALDESLATYLSFPKLTSGTYGVYINGATACIYTTNIWLGRMGHEKDTLIHINGNVDFNSSGTDGVVHFPTPERIIVRDADSYTLAQYITDAATGKIDSITVTADTAVYAGQAYKLVDSKNGTEVSMGSVSEPIYFDQGRPKKCTTTFATQAWVNGKGYLTSIPSEYITETELDAKGYITSSALDSYVSTTTFNETVAVLEAKIAALTPPSTES